MDLQADRRAPLRALVARAGDSDSVPATAAVSDNSVAEVTGAVAVVGPGGLHGEGAGGQGQVGRWSARSLAPCAQVAVLLAGRAGPAARRVLVGDGLGVLMAVHDRHAVQGAGAAGVDEVHATGGASVGGV